MNRSGRRAFLSMAVAMLLVAANAGGVRAASVSFASSYAVQTIGYLDGSVTYKSGSGVRGYLRTTASASGIYPTYVTASHWEGRISSSSINYTGPTGGSVTVRFNGTFTRELNAGVGFASGAGFRHAIGFALRDTTTSTDVREWWFFNEEILCGGLVWPIGLGGCNGTTTDTYASSWSRTTSGSGITKGHRYVLRIYALSNVNAVGPVIGAQAKTTARNLSGSISW